MTDQTVSSIEAAIFNLANAQDDLTGEERGKVVQIMQTLSDMQPGERVDIEACLAEHATATA